MPHKDPEKRKAAMKRWREDVIPKGYGRWLYARRKLRFDDAQSFRETLESIIVFADDPKMSVGAKLGAISFHAQAALEESRKAEEALGRWQRPQS